MEFVSGVDDRSHAWFFLQTPDEKPFDGIWEDLVGQTMVYEGEKPVVQDGVWEVAQHFYCDPRGTRGFVSAHFVEGSTQFSP